MSSNIGSSGVTNFIQNRQQDLKQAWDAIKSLRNNQANTASLLNQAGAGPQSAQQTQQAQQAGMQTGAAAQARQGKTAQEQQDDASFMKDFTQLSDSKGQPLDLWEKQGDDKTSLLFDGKGNMRAKSSVSTPQGDITRYQYTLTNPYNKDAPYQVTLERLPHQKTEVVSAKTGDTSLDPSSVKLGTDYTMQIRDAGGNVRSINRSLLDSTPSPVGQPKFQDSQPPVPPVGKFSASINGQRWDGTVQGNKLEMHDGQGNFFHVEAPAPGAQPGALGQPQGTNPAGNGGARAAAAGTASAAMGAAEAAAGRQAPPGAQPSQGAPPPPPPPNWGPAAAGAAAQAAEGGAGGPQQGTFAPSSQMQANIRWGKALGQLPQWFPDNPSTQDLQAMQNWGVSPQVMSHLGAMPPGFVPQQPQQPQQQGGIGGFIQRHPLLTALGAGLVGGSLPMMMMGGMGGFGGMGMMLPMMMMGGMGGMGGMGMMLPMMMMGGMGGMGGFGGGAGMMLPMLMASGGMGGMGGLGSYMMGNLSGSMMAAPWLSMMSPYL